MSAWDRHVFVLCVLAVCTTAAATSFVCVMVPSNGTVPVCTHGTSTADVNIGAIDSAFRRSNVTDVIFLADRSQSMSEAAFDVAKNSITMLMNYLMLRRLVYLHPDYTRVAVVSFGQQSMVEFDGITSAPIHACNFDDKLANIHMGTAGRNDTNMSAALGVGIFVLFVT